MNLLGIDPGKKGGYCRLSQTGEVLELGRMKLTGKEIDLEPLLVIMSDLRDELLVVIEKVHSMPKQGVASTFAFGLGYGKLLGACEALGVSYELVHPQTWKREILQGSDRSKEATLEWVKRRYPGVDLKVGGKTPSDGVADALCLAEYGRRKFT